MKLGNIADPLSRTLVESPDQTTEYSHGSNTIDTEDEDRDWFITGDEKPDPTIDPVEKVVINHAAKLRTHETQLKDLTSAVKTGFTKILARLDGIERR